MDLKIAPGQAGSELVTERLQGATSIWDFICASVDAVAQKQIGNNRVWVVLGAAGYGKTTLMQHVALELIASNHRRYRLPPRVPVLLYLREYRAQFEQDSIPQLGKLLFTVFAEKTVKPHENWFEEQLKQGKCVVLLDGLDEIADKAQRRRAAAWIAQQIEQYPKTVFVVTARPAPYAETEIDHSRVSMLQMESFTREQQREFLQKWYTATLPAYTAAKVRAKTETTLAEIAQNPSLRELAGNPLLLTMIARNLTLAEGALPQTRSTLYDEFYTVLVRRRADRKGVVDRLRPELKDAVLKTLAFDMMQAKQRELPDAEAQAMIEPQIANLTIPLEQPDFSVLKSIQATTNLILEVSGDRWAFAHLSFQEYLATFELHQQRAMFDWAGVVVDTWWAETLRFYAEQHDATPIVRAALAHNTADTLALADLCRQVTQRLDTQVCNELEQRLDAALEAAGEHQRHTAAAVLLAQRFSVLHAWQRLPMGTEMDTTMITCAEYQLFLDQARRAGEYYHPHHWEEDMPRFERGTARAPIAGVLFGDAQAFVDWLNRRDTKGWLYRLPSVAELEQLPVSVEADMGCWCTATDGTGQLTQLSAERVQQIRKQLAADGPTAVPMPADITNLDLARDLARALDHERTRTLDLNHERTLNRARALDLDCALDLALDQQQATLRDVRRANAALFAQLYQELEQARPTLAREDRKELQLLLDDVAAVYWGIQLIEARAAGRLLVWEGIRLVREPR